MAQFKENFVGIDVSKTRNACGLRRCRAQRRGRAISAKWTISSVFWRGTREEFPIDQRQLAIMAGVALSSVAGLETGGTGGLDLKLAVLEAFMLLGWGEDESDEIGAIAFAS